MIKGVLEAVEMRYLKAMLGCRLVEYRRNEDVRGRSLTDSGTYQIRWLEHLGIQGTMEGNTFPELLLEYKPRGRKDKDAYVEDGEK
jgi:hypothetical protein